MNEANLSRAAFNRNLGMLLTYAAIEEINIIFDEIGDLGVRINIVNNQGEFIDNINAALLMGRLRSFWTNFGGSCESNRFYME